MRVPPRQIPDYATALGLSVIIGEQKLTTL